MWYINTNFVSLVVREQKFRKFCGVLTLVAFVLSCINTSFVSFVFFRA